MTSSYFHHARVGHLLKSRAAESRILYNRLTDESGGTASYELEFPSGGIAHVVGNIIEQGALTSNPTLVSFGAEGYHWPRNELHLVNNTLIDKRASGGVFLVVNPENRRLFAVNNLLVGTGSLETAGVGEYRNNFNAQRADFVDLDRGDYRLRSVSPLTGRGLSAEMMAGVSPVSQREYVHPRHTQALLRGAVSQPGALQGLGPSP